MSIEELRRTADRWDLLTHSFYRRWTRGELSREELQDYACQYHLVVSAMPRWLSDAANRDVAHRDVLAAHARDEAAHIKLWADFALAVGVMPDELDRTVPNEATATSRAAMPGIRATLICQLKPIGAVIGSIAWPIVAAKL